ncbi:MAG: hypothetical protein AAGA68_27405 [Pseudomonadota bacterium]
MPAPYPNAPVGGGGYPPFEVITDGVSNPPAAGDMLLTITNATGSVQIQTSSTGQDYYVGSVLAIAHHDGDIGRLCRMDRDSSAPGDVTHDYGDAAGITVKKLGQEVTSVVAGTQYVLSVYAPVP